MNNDKDFKLTLLGIKISLWTNVLWGVLAFFACFGFLLKKTDLAIMVTITICLAYTITSMIHGAIKSYQALQLMKEIHDEEGKKDE